MDIYNKFNYTGKTSKQEKIGNFNLENIPIYYLIIAGGGGGTGAFSSNTQGAGGGAGGYLNSWNNEQTGGNGAGNNTLDPKNIALGKDYFIQVGAGGRYGGNDAGAGGEFDGRQGFPSQFDNVKALGGGGGVWSTDLPNSGIVGSGGGARSNLQLTDYPPNNVHTLGTFQNQTMGSVGRNAETDTAYGDRAGGGGGGASGDSTTYTHTSSGVAGLSSSINNTAVTRGVGGAGRASGTGNGSNGTANRGNGGQGGAYQSFGYGSRRGGSGGSGIVILRYSSTYTISTDAGLTVGSETTVGGEKYIEITAGAGYVRWNV